MQPYKTTHPKAEMCCRYLETNRQRMGDSEFHARGRHATEHDSSLQSSLALALLRHNQVTQLVRLAAGKFPRVKQL